MSSSYWVTSRWLLGVLITGVAWLLLPATLADMSSLTPAACPLCPVEAAAAAAAAGAQHHHPQEHPSAAAQVEAQAKAQAEAQAKAQAKAQAEAYNVLRLEHIKDQILNKLGLSGKPNVSSPVPHDVLLETMRIVDDTRTVPHKRAPDLEDDLYGRSEIISFAEPGPRFNGQSLLEFAHTQEHKGELRIKSALLWVRVELRPGLRAQQGGGGGAGSHEGGGLPPSTLLHHAKHKKITLLVFRVLPKRSLNTTHLSGKDAELELATTLAVTLGSLGWQKFDVTDAVQQWYTLGSSRGKLRLLVDCSGCGEMVQPSLSLHPLRHHQPHRPFLVLHTDPGAAKRQRRHVLECKDNVRQCCKQSFFVNFTQLGWNDWIIAPRGYFANYCRGHCNNRTPDLYHNYHTVMVERHMQNSQNSRLAGLQPCCSPVRFSSISLIYIDPDYNIIKQDLPKMAVDECGCP